MTLNSQFISTRKEGHDCLKLMTTLWWILMQCYLLRKEKTSWTLIDLLMTKFQSNMETSYKEFKKQSLTLKSRNSNFMMKNGNFPNNQRMKCLWTSLLLPSCFIIDQKIIQNQHQSKSQNESILQEVTRKLNFRKKSKVETHLDLKLILKNY